MLHTSCYDTRDAPITESEVFWALTHTDTLVRIVWTRRTALYVSVALGIENWENRVVIVLRELGSISPSANVVGAKPCTY
jgi:hypothetical protein